MGSYIRLLQLLSRYPLMYGKGARTTGPAGSITKKTKKKSNDAVQRFALFLKQDLPPKNWACSNQVLYILSPLSLDHEETLVEWVQLRFSHFFRLCLWITETFLWRDTYFSISFLLVATSHHCNWTGGRGWPKITQAQIHMRRDIHTNERGQLGNWASDLFLRTPMMNPSINLLQSTPPNSAALHPLHSS